jgi:hypothetical protein
MTIGRLGCTGEETRSCFRALRRIGEECRDFSEGHLELSMGMSDDFPAAIEEGATMIRVGTYLLGERSHP